MNQLSKIIIALLLAATTGCERGNLEIKKSDFDVGIKKDGNKTCVSVSQKVDLLGYYKDNLDFKVTIRYTPIELTFMDYPNMPELPKPLPMSMAPTNIPSNKILSISKYNEELEQIETEPFSIPYEIRGITKVNDGTLDTLVGTNQVRRLQQYSLGNVSVIYSTIEAWQIDEVEINRYSRWKVEDYVNQETRFSLDKPSDELKRWQKGSRRRAYYILSGDQQFYLPCRRLNEKIIHPLRGYFEDERIKSYTDEMVWQISHVEAIEGLFPLIEEYESRNPSNITHFAIVLDYDFGIGQTFETSSESKSSLFSSFAKSDAEASARYTIHLSGITATKDTIIHNNQKWEPHK